MKWSLLGRSFVLGVGLFSAAGAAAQTVINEGSNRNFGDVFDEDGDAPDWVELYNAGAVAVDLAGFAQSARPGVFAMRIAPLQVRFHVACHTSHVKRHTSHVTTPAAAAA